MALDGIVASGFTLCHHWMHPEDSGYKRKHANVLHV